MNLYDYIIHKGLEKAQTETIKQIIWNDISLSYQQKAAWINSIDAYSKAKDMKEACDLLAYLMRR